MSLKCYKSSLVLKNNTASDIKILGMKIKVGKKADLFDSVIGLTEDKVIKAMQKPQGELYLKLKRGILTLVSSTMNSFENDPGYESSDVVTTTSDCVVHQGSVVLCDATAGNLVITLPLASLTASRRLEIKKIDATAHTVTVRATSPNTIDGELDHTIEDQFTALTIVSSGSEYYLV